MFAAQEGHEAVARLLVQAGATLDKTDSNGGTALMVAADHGHEAVTRLLVEAGCINARFSEMSVSQSGK